MDSTAERLITDGIVVWRLAIDASRYVSMGSILLLIPSARVLYTLRENMTQQALQCLHTFDMEHQAFSSEYSFITTWKTSFALI